MELMLCRTSCLRGCPLLFRSRKGHSSSCSLTHCTVPIAVLEMLLGFIYDFRAGSTPKKTLIFMSASEHDDESELDCWCLLEDVTGDAAFRMKLSNSVPLTSDLV